MKYFEFNKTDYYALIAVKDSCTMIDAMKIYVENVAYESVDEMRLSSFHPIEITKDQALLKYLIAPMSEDYTVSTLKKEFDECENGLLLVDVSLI